MGTKKRYTDSELAARTRASNQQRAARRGAKKRAAGLTTLTVWIDAATRDALTCEAEARDNTLTRTAAHLLKQALRTPTEQATP
jgi:hypothetical protein